MPELPEVETIRRDLFKKVIGKKIGSVEVIAKKSIQSDLKKFLNSILNQKFIDLDRIGKLLIFSLSNKKDYLLIHLKMTGQLVCQSKTEVVAGGHSLPGISQIGGFLPNKSTRAYFVFSDGSQLFFNDQRRFGYLKVVDSKGLEEIKNKYGIEPLRSNFDLNSFGQVIKSHKRNIKALLLDQTLISGLGNIYVDEVLFASKISPLRRSDSLNDLEIKKLHLNIQQIIKKAIEFRGTTFNNYVDGEGREGKFVKRLKVYGRKGEKCLICGDLLKKIKVAGRGTHFCQNCQK